MPRAGNNSHSAPNPLIRHGSDVSSRVAEQDSAETAHSTLSVAWTQDSTASGLHTDALPHPWFDAFGEDVNIEPIGFERKLFATGESISLNVPMDSVKRKDASCSAPAAFHRDHVTIQVPPQLELPRMLLFDSILLNPPSNADLVTSPLWDMPTPLAAEEEDELLVSAHREMDSGERVVVSAFGSSTRTKRPASCFEFPVHPSATAPNIEPPSKGGQDQDSCCSEWPKVVLNRRVIPSSEV